MLLKEFDPFVYRFYDQPPRLDLSYKSGSRKVRVASTLDYFVISKGFVGYEKWKPFCKFENLAKKSPDRFCYDEKLGRFVSPAIERALDGTGLKYKLCTERDLNPLTINNFDFLNGYFHNVEEFYEDKDPSFGIKKLVEFLEKQKYCTIQDALGLCSDSDAFYYAVAAGHVYFPLDFQDVIELANSKVFIDSEAFKAFQLVNEENDQEQLFSHNLSPKLLSASEKDIASASKKLRLLTEHESGSLSFSEIATEMDVSERTVRRWYESVKGIDVREEKLCALLSSVGNRGNRLSKIPDKVIDHINVVINTEYLSRKAIIPHQVAIRVRNWCRANDIEPPSKPTVYRYINLIPDTEKLLRRKGSKAAYQTETNALTEESMINFNAKYYLHRCHIDHTELDVETVTDFGDASGKPWLSYVKDEYTNKNWLPIYRIVLQITLV